MKANVNEHNGAPAPTVFGCSLRSPPVWRQILWIFLFFIVLAVGLKVIPQLDKHGYFDWAADLPLQALAAVFCMGLMMITLLALSLASRHTKKYRRPAYVPLLSGYNGPRQTRRIPFRRDAFSNLPDYQQLRLYLLQVHSIVLVIFFAPLAGMLLTAIGARFISGRFAPGANPDNFWTLGAVIGSGPVSIYFYSLIWARILIRRKGADSAMRFMFTSAVCGRVSFTDRIVIKALGLNGALKSAIERYR